jgi:hypothetical protein
VKGLYPETHKTLKESPRNEIIFIVHGLEELILTMICRFNTMPIKKTQPFKKIENTIQIHTVLEKTLNSPRQY